MHTKPSGQTRLHSRILAAASQLKTICERRGLSRDGLSSILAATPGIQSTIDWIFDPTGEAPPRKEMLGLISAMKAELELGEDLVHVDLKGRGAKAAAAARSVFAGSVFALSGWVVLGCILSSQNELARSTSPAMVLLILALSIVWLALLEAAHIGAVALSVADVSELNATHPRVVGIHRYIDTKEKLERYLAARQVGVVLTVFLISEVTRTPGLAYLPGTSIAVPAELGLLFRIGAPGALLVLVLGQVLPQIITARRPATMMNKLPMVAAFHATRLIGLLGLAEPASWLVAWAKRTERIPSAARQRYEATTLDGAGYGCELWNSTVTVAPFGTEVETTSAVAFNRDGFDGVEVILASCPTSPSELRVDASISRDGELMPAVSTGIEERRVYGSDAVGISSRFAPNVGHYRPGDVLVVRATLRFQGAHFVETQSVIALQTRVAVTRVLLSHPTWPLPPAEFDAAGSAPGGPRTLVQPRTLPDGSVEFVARATYVEPGTRLVLRWRPAAARDAIRQNAVVDLLRAGA